MLSIHTNYASLATQRTIALTSGRLAGTMTRLGTGFRVNSAMDDAAGLQIATRLKAQSSGMDVAMENIHKSQSILQTADGALDESTTILLRMKDLATQAADASSAAMDRQAMQAEYAALSNQLSNIAIGTTFGGTKLLLGDTVAERAAVQATTANAVAFAALSSAALGTANAQYAAALAADAAGSTSATQSALAVAAADVATYTLQTSVAQTAANDAQAYAAKVALATVVNGIFSTTQNFQIGASSNEVMTVTLTPLLDAMHTALHGAATTYDTFGIANSASGSDVITAALARSSIDKLSQAVDAVAGVRAAIGAYANRLDHAFNNQASMERNTKLATGRIMDTDFAQESAGMISGQMLMQASTTMLRQSNSISSMVMGLLA